MTETICTEIDELVAAFYAAFDNRGSRVPAEGELRNMFSGDARITRVSPERVETWTVDEFIAPRVAMLMDGTLTEFHEWETHASTTVAHDAAIRRSHYGKAGTLHGAPYVGQGNKSIQLCRAGDRWLITSVRWEDY